MLFGIVPLIMRFDSVKVVPTVPMQEDEHKPGALVQRVPGILESHETEHPAMRAPPIRHGTEHDCRSVSDDILTLERVKGRVRGGK